MEKNITIRPERVSDYQQVEDIIRQAFYNLYTPGCTEHYLAHAIRPLSPAGMSRNKQLAAKLVRGGRFWLLSQLYRIKNRI